MLERLVTRDLVAIIVDSADVPKPALVATKNTSNQNIQQGGNRDSAVDYPQVLWSVSGSSSAVEVGLQMGCTNHNDLLRDQLPKSLTYTPVSKKSDYSSIP